MPYFNFDGKRIYYDTTGEGEPLLLIHGNLVSSNMFIKDLDFYSGRFKVILFDYPGHGRSERLFRFRDDFWYYNAQAAISLLNLLDIGKTNIIGTSGGAIVGLNIASTNSSLVNKMIADSFFGERLSFEDAKEITANNMKAKKKLLSIAFWKAMHGDDWEKIVDLDAEMLLRISRDNLPLYPAGLENVNCPVLITCSTADELIPHIKEKMFDITKKIKGSVPLIFHTGKHPFMITEKELFHEVVKQYFSVE